jgi:hypothetical protein
MRQPRASVCAGQCLLLDQCRAFEFEDHINETWCSPSLARATYTDARTNTHSPCTRARAHTQVPPLFCPSEWVKDDPGRWSGL